MQRQVQMIQKMPSDFTADIQNMLMPVPAKQQCSRQVQCCRSRADDLEMRESSKAPPDMKTGRSMRTCLSRGVPADHEARSQVKVEEKSSTAGKKALTGGLKRSHDRIQRCGGRRATVSQHNSATVQRDTAEQEERPQLTAVRMDVHQPTQRSRQRYLVCYCCPESEAAIKTLLYEGGLNRETDISAKQVKKK